MLRLMAVNAAESRIAMANNAPSGEGSAALIPREVAQIASSNTVNNRIPFIDPHMVAL
jgi:hypothetical protein